MKDGKTAYLGPIAKLKDYFERGQMPIRDGINIADFVGAGHRPGGGAAVRGAPCANGCCPGLLVSAMPQWT